MATPIQVTLGICQATAAEINAFEIQERLDTLEDYADMTANDVSSLTSKMERRTGARRISVSAKVIKNINALCFWASECQRTGKPLDENEFTMAVLVATKVTMRLRADDTPDAPSIKPDKFKPDKWKTWSRLFLVYLSHIKGAQYKSLDYVTRPEPAPATFTNEREQELYACALTGPHFRSDNNTVYRLIYELVSDTDGYTWIQDFHNAQNGRLAWQALITHYDGGGQ
jgi:hypothetical protein